MTENSFPNVYADSERADAYATLEFPGTYYLAFRDLPAILADHVGGTNAIDFGCGAGRSTRFLRGLGYDVIGVDISEPMVRRARASDSGGEYHVVTDGALDRFPADAFDLVFAAFTFDNIGPEAHKVALFRTLGRLIAPGTGRIVNLVSAPEIYTHEWASFTTKAFPDNRAAKSGDRVRIVMLDVDDRRPVEDIFCTDDTYRDIYRRAGLECLRVHRPLGTERDPHRWITETAVSPWAIYVLARSE